MRKCTNCLHGKENEVNELVCDLGRKINTPQCSTFAPKNEYIEEMIKENNGRELFSYLFIVGIATIGCVFFFGCLGLFETPDSNIFDNPYLCTLLIIGVLCLTVAGISPLALRLRRNSVKQEVRRELEDEVRQELAPKLLTRNIIKRYLDEQGMSPEPITGNDGIKFISHDIRYEVFYDEERYMTIRYGCMLDECNVKNARDIILSHEGAVFGVQRYIQEFKRENDESAYVLFCDADFIVEDQLSFKRDFPRYLHQVERAFNNVYLLIDKGRKEENNKIDTHQYIYHPEYRWIPEIIQMVSKKECAPDALIDEEWIRSVIQRNCQNDGCRAQWDNFRINRVDKFGNFKLIIYQFPEPKVAPEAKYGAVLMDVNTLESNYYTLEMSLDNLWYYGGVADTRHLNYGLAESTDLDKFIEWVLSSSKTVVAYTDYAKRND